MGVGYYLNQQSKLMSATLFGAQDEETKFQALPDHVAKNKSFREEIRRRNNSERFRAIRKELAQSLNSLQFLEDLKSERDNITPKRIHELVIGLEQGLNKASFYQSILDMGLEHYLCDMFRHPELQLPEKTKILRTLVELTYFSSSMEAIAQNHLLDDIMTMMKGFSMEDEFEESFAFFASSLVQNITTVKSIDLLLYVMESDFMPILHSLLQRSIRKDENLMYYRSDLRENLLRIYYNLCFFETGQREFICKALYTILEDSRNYENEHVANITLGILSNVARLKGVWKSLQDQQFGNYGILFDRICEISACLLPYLEEDGKDILKGVQNFVIFVTRLYEHGEFEAEAADDFLRMLEPQTMGRMISAVHQINTGESKRIVCEIFEMLFYAISSSSESGLTFKFFFPSSVDASKFLQVLIKRNYMTHPHYGKYSVRLLWCILKEDKSKLDAMEENGVYDAILDLLDSECLQSAKVETIQLVERMIEAEECLKGKKESNRLVEGFHERGIVKKIEGLQEHPERKLYKRAEAFMSWLSQLSAPNE